MKTADKRICIDCERNLRDAQLVYKKLPGSEEAAVCDFCRRKRFCAVCRIRYGRER